MNRRAIDLRAKGGRAEMNDETNQGLTNQPPTQEPQGSSASQRPVEHTGLGGTYAPVPSESPQPPADQASDAVNQTPSYEPPVGASYSPPPRDPAGDQPAPGGPFGSPPANLPPAPPAHKGDSPLLLAAVFASGILTVAAIVGVYAVVR
jgi:hypothetical protein